MTQAAARVLEDAEQLSPSDRAEIADRIVEGLSHDLPADLEQAHVSEVRRRIAEVESGDVAIVPGEEALARVRGLVASGRAVS